MFWEEGREEEREIERDIQTEWGGSVEGRTREKEGRGLPQQQVVGKQVITSPLALAFFRDSLTK